ncbi:glycoside hydrolase family 43 protein [Microbispora sp. ATCC PTA-5024]|uniref:glycoside hydrolase family 43 protein n=1 Tax=Microbispora sp. ATCC PTA-5024 TaxID=316330 RepID=UPI0003DCEAA2|nr:glycoside hydrolase family 43 protein [Microbispora sp. ATCC PTA-5024]ETK32344.1 arabinofuranosidase [Microbispora sp. ATCC PTA-5024]
MRTYTNPVIPGSYPDPSICRVGEDYYLVTSSFEWFPGVPIFHSRDLVHWRQIGHVLDRPSQLDLDGVRPSGGIYAPTIRHHDGVFYMITTLMDEAGTFLVTADDPAGPWSDPVWLPALQGIDPSLFFDDGRVWVTGTREKAKAAYSGETEIWLQELDRATLAPIGEEHVIWEAVQRGAVWCESPHLYKVGGRYFLLTAEGGTADEHSVMVARADRVTGPYASNPRNPVLTHRHLGSRYAITSVGHADLVETPDGEWWAVLLAVRPYDGGRNLGRETFLTRVHWEDGWPLADLVAPEAPAPAQQEHRWPAEPLCDHFDAERLSPVWNLLRTPREPYWSLEGGRLRLRLRPETLAQRANPSLVARRQQHRDFAVHAALDFSPSAGECAGLVLVRDDDNHVLLVRTARGLQLVRRAGGRDELLASVRVPEGRLHLGVEARGQSYQARFAVRPGEWRDVGGPVDGLLLSPPPASGFTGAYVGMYASSNGHPSTAVAEFDWFEYRPLC